MQATQWLKCIMKVLQHVLAFQGGSLGFKSLFSLWN